MTMEHGIPMPLVKHAQPPKVALLVETSNGYARGLLGGVEHYIRHRGPWNVLLSERRRGDDAPRWIESWDGDGIIARVENEKMAALLRQVRQPVVNLSSTYLLPRAPVVTTDNQAIAREAMEHFLGRGFENFAFCGLDQFGWSEQRGNCFEALLRERGHGCHRFNVMSAEQAESDAQIDEIARWLLSLPKPIAIMACYDARGQQVLEACQRARLSVPEEVAVLGVDNDQLLCSLAPPPLSSIDPNALHSGWLAAALLDQMMAGLPVDIRSYVLSPAGIITRQSTDVLAADDHHVAQALRFIRERGHEGINVADVVNVVGISRRSLEIRMKKIVGRSPHEEIMRVQINRAKQLMLASFLTLAEVAERCGFQNTEYLSVAFKRATGMSPRDYRKRHGER